MLFYFKLLSYILQCNRQINIRLHIKTSRKRLKLHSILNMFTLEWWWWWWWSHNLQMCRSRSFL